MKKICRIILFLLFSFIAFDLVSASTNTIDRTTIDNKGVNKSWKIDDSNINNVLNTPYVNAEEKVYDFSEILDDNTELELYNKIQEFISKTNMDMVIVTVDLPYSYDSKNEEYAADFYDYNDFGINFDKYSGVLILRNTYSIDPYYNIYTFGDAQLYYSYDELESILDSIYYDLHVGNYKDGFTTFINECIKYYNDGISDNLKGYYVDGNGYLHQKFAPSYTIICRISLIISIIITLIIASKNKMVKKATKAYDYLDKNSINITGKSSSFIRSQTSSYTESSSSGSHSSGGGSGFSHSGSSGGGHSSGGGRHG